MRVHIIADYDEAQLKSVAQQPGWQLSQQMDAAKMAAVCRLSWELQRWEVAIIRSTDEIELSYEFGNSPGYALVVTADVYNRFFLPDELSSLHAKGQLPCTLHKDGSASAMVLNDDSLATFREMFPTHLSWRDAMMFFARNYPALITERSMVNVLGLHYADKMTYCFCGPDWRSGRLIHFTRSSMQWFYGPNDR